MILLLYYYMHVGMSVHLKLLCNVFRANTDCNPVEARQSLVMNSDGCDCSVKVDLKSDKKAETIELQMSLHL